MPARKKRAGFDYQRYLASREWGLKKRAVRERAEGICERCGEAKIAATHHLTYDRLGDEELDDLVGVCKPCHEYLGGVSDEDPLTNGFEEALAEAHRCVAQVGQWKGTSYENDSIAVLRDALEELEYRSARRRVAAVMGRVREEKVLALLPKHDARRAEWEHFFTKLPGPMDAERELMALEDATNA